MNWLVTIASLCLFLLFVPISYPAHAQDNASTIQGTVIIKRIAKMDIDVVLQKCSAQDCVIVQTQRLDFNAEKTSINYSFSVPPGTYRVSLLKPSDQSLEFVYLFSNAAHYQRNIIVTDCNPSGIVRQTIQGQQCELKDYGIVGFVICNDIADNCTEKDALNEYQNSSENMMSKFFDDGHCNISTGRISCRVNTGICSVCNLEPYFTDSPTKSARDKAFEASQICQGESGGNPFAINRGCMRGGAREYSVGLFQINLLWRGRCPQDSRAPQCSESDSLLIACRDYYFNPKNNIAKMLAMSGNGTNWRPWTVARKCGITR